MAQTATKKRKLETNRMRTMIRDGGCTSWSFSVFLFLSVSLSLSLSLSLSVSLSFSQHARVYFVDGGWWEIKVLGKKISSGTPSWELFNNRCEREKDWAWERKLCNFQCLMYAFRLLSHQLKAMALMLSLFGTIFWYVVSLAFGFCLCVAALTLLDATEIQNFEPPPVSTFLSNNWRYCFHKHTNGKIFSWRSLWWKQRSKSMPYGKAITLWKRAGVRRAFQDKGWSFLVPGEAMSDDRFFFFFFFFFFFLSRLLSSLTTLHAHSRSCYPWWSP